MPLRRRFPRGPKRRRASLAAALHDSDCLPAAARSLFRHANRDFGFGDATAGQAVAAEQRLRGFGSDDGLFA